MPQSGTEPIERALLERIEHVAAARGMPMDPKVRAAAVSALSETYTRRRDQLGDIPGDPATLLPRLVFFLPRDMARVQMPMEELRLAHALPSGRTWRVLDLGAGLGAASLGAAAFAGGHALADVLSVVAVDHDASALGVLRDMFERPVEVGLPPTTLETRTADATALPPSSVEGPFDLILAGLVLNELWDERFDEAAATQWIHRWAAKLAPGGAMIVIEPALREPARRLMRVRDQIASEAGPLTVFAPCLRRGPCPMLPSERDWCHTDRPGHLPESVAQLASAAGLRAHRLTLAYLTIRSDGRRLADAVQAAEGEPYRVVSGLLRSKGKCERLGCGTPGLVRWMRLDRHAGVATEEWERAQRGDVVVVTGAEPRDQRARMGPQTHVRRAFSH